MYLLGYDIGSSSVKAAVVDAYTGKVVATDYYPKQEAPIKALKEGWAEQSPQDWWHSLKMATRSVIASGNINPADIKAIGISYQMHGLVAVDKNRRVLRDAIIWCDSRGVKYGQKAVADLGSDALLPRLLNLPGNFTASKLAWVKENEPDVFARIDKVLLPGDWIAMRLTGETYTTASGLSECTLWDFNSNAPANFMMDYYGFAHELLPVIRPTFGEQGQLTPAAAAQLGLTPGTPITYRAGDQPNNALSLNVFNPGEIAATAGTSGVIYGINDTLKYDKLSRVNCFAHVNHSKAAPRIGVLACINGTGILNSWLRRNMLAEGIGYEQMNALAASAPIGSAGLSVLPFGNGAERVLQNKDSGASLHGINFNIHTRAHILRAAQEGIVFSLVYGMEIMRQMGMGISTVHAGRANMFLSHVFRDTLASASGATIKLMDTDGAAGAAKGAGIGAGIYTDNNEAFSTLVVHDVIQPSPHRDAYLEAYGQWKENLNQIDKK